MTPASSRHREQRHPASRLRRGEATAIAVATLTVVSMLATVYFTGGEALDQARAIKTLNEIKEMAPQLAQQSLQLMELKVEQMHRRGDLTEAEFELAINKMKDPRNTHEFNEIVNELYRKQNELADTGYWQYIRNTTVTLAFIFSGIFAEESAGELLTQYDSETARQTIQQISNWLGISINSAGILASVTGPWSGERFVTPEQFLQILDDAERRMQGESSESQMQAGVRARVHSFFDKWHRNHLERITLQQFYDQFKPYKDKLTKEFNQYIEGELTEEGWVIEPEGLRSFAWACMEEYGFYKQTFELGVTGDFVLYFKDPGSGKLMPAQMPSSEGGSRPALLKCRVDQAGGTPVCTVDFTIPREAAEACRKMGVTFPQGLQIPLELVESETVPYFRSESPDVQRLVAGVFGLIGALMHASENIFMETLFTVRAEPQKGILTIVSPPDSANLVIKFDYDCVVKVIGDNIQSHRMQGATNLLGRRIAPPPPN